MVITFPSSERYGIHHTLFESARLPPSVSLLPSLFPQSLSSTLATRTAPVSMPTYERFTIERVSVFAFDEEVHCFPSPLSITIIILTIDI
jgi:hypothetical protein